MKTKIKKIYLHNLRVGEIYSFLLVVHETLLVNQNLNPKLKQLTTELGVVLADLKKSMNAGNFKNESSAVKNADKKRDNRIVSFRLFIEWSCHSENPTIKELANIILEALNDAGKNIASLSLKEETAAIHSLNELFTSNSRYVDALAGVKGNEGWNGVWNAQQDFEGVYGYRNGVMVEEKLDASAYEVAKKAKRLCSTIFELIEDLNNVEGKPEYLTIMDKINIEVEKTMAAVRTRETNAAKAKEEAEKENS